MLPALVFLTSVASVLGAPQAVPYNPETAGLAYFNQQYQAYQDTHQGYNENYKAFQEQYEKFKKQWETFWNNLVSQYGPQGAWNVLPDKIPGLNFVQGIVQPGVDGVQTVAGYAPAYAPGSVVSAISAAGSNAAAGLNQLSGSNGLSGSNALSGQNSNAGLNSNLAAYNQQSALATSGTNTNSGNNALSGTNALMGTNTGPNNYNGPLSGASSVVNQPTKKPIFIQGAVSNVGNAGSIYVP